MAANDVYRGGINKSAQSRRALVDWMSFYQSLFKFRSTAPLQTWFGIDASVAQAIKDGKLEVPRAGDFYPYLINTGGRGSSKTFLVSGLVTNHAASFPQAQVLVMRKHWLELQRSIGPALMEVINMVTDGHPEYILADGEIKRKDGYFEAEVFAPGKQLSHITIRPEPDKATEREIADAIKGPEYSLVWLDELTQLKKITLDTGRDNLRNKHVPQVRLIGTTNPPTKGHWLYDLQREMEVKLANGERPRYMVVRSKPADNPFLRPGYLEQLKEDYKDDPVLYAMYVEGQDGIDVSGTPVYNKKYNHQKNRGKLLYSPFSPIIVGMDFGWNWNVAVFGQLVDKGYINVLGELGVQGYSIKQFGKAIQDYITQKFPAAKLEEVIYYGDPNTAVQTNMHTGVTTATELRRNCGIRLEWAKRRVEHGISTLKDLLTDYGVEGTRPRLMFHEDRCPETTMAFLAGYRLKETGGNVTGEPHKDHYFDHWADAARYLTDNLVGPYYDIKLRRRASGGPYVAKGMTPKRGELNG